MSRLRAAIIGAGRMGSTIDDEIREADTWPSLKRQLPYAHAACYAERRDAVEMVAVCDLDDAKRRTFCQRWDVPRHYADWREMIETERPDIVSIAVAAHMHAAMAIGAMDRGVRGIYCEKAMCCSLGEAEDMVAAVKRNNAVFMLGAQRRHHPHFRETRRIVQSGDLGELMGVYSWLHGALLHTLSHTADNSLFLAGDAAPLSVYAILPYAKASGRGDTVESRRMASGLHYNATTKRWSGDPGCATYTVRLDNGVLLVHLPAFMDLRWEAVCTDGYLRIVDNNNALQIYRRKGRTYSFEAVDCPPVPPASAHLALLDDLIDCVRTGSKPLANETAGLYGMQILTGAATSHLEGGKAVSPRDIDRDMVIPSH